MLAYTCTCIQKREDPRPDALKILFGLEALVQTNPVLPV